MLAGATGTRRAPAKGGHGQVLGAGGTDASN